MTAFSSLVSQFANDGNGEGSSSQDKKRTRSNSNLLAQGPDDFEEFTSELTTQVRKSMRINTTHTRVVGADSVKTRPHYRRPTPHPSSSRVTVKDEDYQDDKAIVDVKDEADFQPKGRLLPSGVRLGPQDDRSMPALYNMGLTNLVDRPSRSGAELSSTEARAAAPTLMAKIKKYRPRFVCFVSKQAWDMFAGVGLGLQTAWVSWYDEVEDDALMSGSGGEDDKAVIQHNLGAQGYRMSPYFEEGPGAAKMEQELAAEGVPSSFGSQEYRSAFVKREPGTRTLSGLHMKYEEDKEKKDIKMDMDLDDHDVKVKVEEETKVKTEQEIKVKMEQDAKVKMENSASSSRMDVKREQDQDDQSKGPPAWPKRGVVRGSRMFVMPSTSGRVTQYRKEDKLAYFKQLAELVRRDRQLRGL
ncbi:hypothetical protein BG006_004256 [Podila minutissima]|uniref:Uncharacterized protein n=1 Tax=Podila minutissima TaxID=64525 RepID=A0A9P5SNV7_9FUNG|nr:hypothetical protein BG006_004256 [Podila minutissima]